ncbi:putative metal-dependent peptidase [Desulfohalotomaculum tongense]|uniref:vWA domain-containing protein n=1 Tax=Desulforadius tongensis TaxID=1216062 RepID=UPI00195D5095|nr:VWA-like domain-containing protein [Desulforadius tongensis]MBM7854386.1 putative metal-dependent peptidase [Desulforadius tongensis]
MNYEKQAETKLTRAKIKVLLKNPFLGTLVMYLTPEPRRSVKKADTDGEKFYYNPQWIDGLTEDETAAVICHTVLHCALGHLWRRSFRNPHRWNKACDYVVNLILEAEGYPISPGLVVNKLYQNKSAEEVYSLLSTGENDGRGAASSPGGSGGGENADQNTGRDNEQENPETALDQHQHWEDKLHQRNFASGAVERLWKERAARALQSARSRGDLPGALERAVGELLRPEKDWRQILAEFLTKIKSDYSWLPPDRRLVYYNILVPDLGREEERLEEVVVAVDSSGSVNNKQLQKFLSEVRGIINSFSTITGHLVFCDSKIQSWHRLRDFNEVIPRGGGGSYTKPVFEEINKRKIKPSALIYFTDGITVYPTFEPSYPVLWLLTKEHSRPPWGRKAVFDSLLMDRE